jgi:hypothetical protein
MDVTIGSRCESSLVVAPSVRRWKLGSDCSLPVLDFGTLLKIRFQWRWTTRFCCNCCKGALSYFFIQWWRLSCQRGVFFTYVFESGCWTASNFGLIYPGSAFIPEASILYRYCIVLVSIARIDIKSIRYRFLTAFTPHPLNSFFLTFLYNDSIKIYP